MARHLTLALTMAVTTVVAASAHAEDLAACVAAFRQGDYAAARSCFERAAAAAPSDARPHLYLGVLADQAGDLAAAERHLSAAARLAPGMPEARNNYGALLVKLGRSAEARREFEAVLGADPRHVSALVNMGQLLATEATPASLARAREYFDRAASIRPDGAVLRALALIALKLGDVAAAKGYLEHLARSTWPGTTTTATDRVALGAALLDAGLAAQALPELSAATAADPSSVNAVVLLSRAQLATGEGGAAVRTLEQALARGLTAPPLYAALAHAHEEARAFELAIPAMKAAVDADPTNESYQFRYGMLLVQARAPAAAVIRLKEAVAAQPASARLWFALGLAHFNNNMNEPATDAFERALALDPSFAPAHAYLGMTLVSIGRFEDAMRRYEQALALEPDLAVAHYLAGDALAKHTPPDLDRAEQFLARAVDLNPSFAPAMLALGKVHAQQGKFAEAATLLERVVRADPTIAEAHYQLGRAYMRLQRRQEAEAELALFQKMSDEAREHAVTEREELVRRLASVRF